MIFGIWTLAKLALADFVEKMRQQIYGQSYISLPAYACFPTFDLGCS
jgi:hypothetical protein